MTRAMRPLPIPLPLGSLLPPSGVSPSQALPRSLAVLGPLPPTTPIHLALNYLYLSDLPDFDHNAHEPGNGRPKEKDRVLIITGPEDSSKHAIKEDDEDYLRERGGDYTFLERLRRVDIRYCPSVKHVKLLLSLLSRGKEGSHQVVGRPGLVVLWNIGTMLMDTEEANENELVTAATDSEQQEVHRAGKKFKREYDRAWQGRRSEYKANQVPSVTISDYLDLIAAAQASVDHFSSLDTTKPPTSLMVFEPDFTPDASLPILSTGEAAETIPKGSREKRISVRTGLERLLGPQSLASVIPAHIDEQGAAVYTLSLADHPEETFSLRRRPCPRADWYSAARDEVDVDGLPRAEGDPGGWRWEWT